MEYAGSVLLEDAQPMPHQRRAELVQFFEKPIEFKKESEREGRPIFKNVTFIRIIIPGGDILENKVNDHYKQKYAREWNAWLATKENLPQGMPLSEWPSLTLSQIEEYKYLKVYTVEQIADASDTLLQRMGANAREMRAKAQAFLKVNEDAAAAQRYAAENERMKLELLRLQEQIDALKAESERPKRGRPRKEDENEEAS